MGTSARDILNASSLANAPLNNSKKQISGINSALQKYYSKSLLTSVRLSLLHELEQLSRSLLLIAIVTTPQTKQAPMSGRRSLSPDGIRHRRTGSQKPKISHLAEFDEPLPKSPSITSSSNRRVPSTGSRFTLSPSERDILVLSIFIKVLLFPAQ